MLTWILNVAGNPQVVFEIYTSPPHLLGNNELLYNLFPGLILGLRPANERRRYKVTPSLIGWAQT